MEKGCEMKEVNNHISATTVFACRFDVPFVDGFSNPSFCGKFSLCWDIYGTQYDRVRTVCYGLYRPVSLDGESVCISGIAMLNRKHPEEFDVVSGIKKSFGRLVYSVTTPLTSKSSNKSYKSYRKNIWKHFLYVFEKYFSVTDAHPFGVWRVSWNDDFLLDNDRIHFLFSDPNLFFARSVNENEGEWNDTFQ